MSSGFPSLPLNKNLGVNAGMSEPELRLQAVKDRVAAAEKRAHRAIDSVALIAVSKTIPAEGVLSSIQNFASTEAVNLGENYVQEAVKKMDWIKIKFPQLKIKWHLIGALQTNKSKEVVGKFETIQSIDRLELARALDKRAGEASIVQNILVQVKLGDEPSKGGVDPLLLSNLLKQITELKNLRLEGLMSLPPIEAEPEASRKYFVQLRDLRAKNHILVPATSGSFSHLSMGTTHDFEVAIEEGATMVRVGTAIFGIRETEAGIA
jgi:pyridoxal phosphate enzyme (YggS family)